MLRVLNYTDVINEVQSYMASTGGNWSDWYVGITSDIKSRLFGEHGVDVRQDRWIYKQCINSETARRAEDYFVKKGTRGDTGGGDWTSNFIYAYYVTSRTREQ